MSSGLEHVVQENPYSVTFRRSSSKGAPKTRWAESTLEYDFFCVLDFDQRVEKYQEQPVVIPWRTPSGQYRRYTPDVLVKFCATEFEPGLGHLRSTIFEIKPYEVLRKNWATLRPKVRGVQRSLEGTFVPFKIVTERQLRPAFVQNVKFLLEYDTKRIIHNDRVTRSQVERMTAVNRAIPIYRTTTPREILNSITSDPLEQAYLVPWVWHKLREGNLQADLIEPLTVDTMVWDERLNRPRAKWMTKEYDWYR